MRVHGNSPFELSARASPALPHGVSRATRFRFGFGRAGTQAKLDRLVGVLREWGAEFVTCADLRAIAIASRILEVPE
jgi:hypothetical protein